MVDDEDDILNTTYTLHNMPNKKHQVYVDYAKPEKNTSNIF